jgi:hypothetical protein
MPTPRRIWKEILVGYRFIAYCTPPLWYWAWERQRFAIDPAPWWAHVLGVALVVPAIACMSHIQDEGVE